MTQNHNIWPYYDDFDKDKNYQKILFVPNRAVQARELTQIQSTIQHQIESMGNFLFKNGTVVIPGHVYYDNKVEFVRLESTYNGVLTDDIIDDLVGSTVTGVTSGVKAKVVAVRKSTSSDQPVIFVKYTQSNGEQHDFLVEELDCSVLTTMLKVDNVSNYSGVGAICSIGEGVFYVNGYFVQVLAQKIPLSLNTTPSCRVGLKVVESIVTAEDDTSLYDSSEGFVNKTMQGADRYKLSLELATRSLYSEDDDTTEDVEFVDLLHVNHGEIQYKLEFAKLGELEKNLAKRTYDESGDYIVEPFNFTVGEYRNNNRGVWAAGKPYLEGDIVTSNGVTWVATNAGYSGNTAPVLTSDTDAESGDGGQVTWVATTKPEYNNGKHYSDGETLEEHQADEAKGVLYYNKGTMYIKGFEVDAEGYHEIDFQKARKYVDRNNTAIVPEVGNYIQVSNVRGLPDFNTCPLAELRRADDYVYGNLRIRGLEYVSGSGSTAIYKLYVFAVSMEDRLSFSEVTKIRIGTTAAPTTDASFECDIVPQFQQIEGSVSVSGNTLTGVGTALTKYRPTGRKFRVGTQPSSATSFRFTVATDTGGTTSVNLGTIPANTPIWVEVAKMEGNKGLLLPLPHEYIRTLRTNTQVDTTYTVRRTSDFSWATGGASPTISLTNDNEDLLPKASGNYFLARVAHTNGSGAVVYALNSAITISSDNKTLTIDMTDGELSGIQTSGGGLGYRLFYSVQKKNSAALEKNKQVKRKSVIFDTYDGAKETILYLGEADVNRIISVSISGGTEFDADNPSATVAYSATGQEDVTDDFILNNGQTDSFYGVASIRRKDGAHIPSAPIKVVFEYFDHGKGDYFSVDSYTDAPYQNIGSFGGRSLRDVVDMRPRMADDMSGFTATGSSRVEFVSPSDFMTFDYSYYLGRKDVVVCDAQQKIKIIRGKDSLDPEFPTVTSSNQVVIGKLEVAPYTARANSKFVKFSAERMERFTMKDIGALAQRLENVEEYVAMTLLEKQTKEMEITDKFGNDRYKSGFLADGFLDHGTGYADHPDYIGSVREGSFVPVPVVNSIDMVEESASSQKTRHYAVTGDVVSLPYTQVKAIEQRVATRPEFVNPFSVYAFRGGLDVFPKIDKWFEYVQLPDIDILKEGNFATVSAAAKAAGILGTVYGSWRVSGTTTDGANITTTSARDFTTKAVQERINEVSRSRKIVANTPLPWARKRTLVVSTEGLLPNAAFFFWAESRSLQFQAATVLSITKTNTKRFIGAKGSKLLSDNLDKRRLNDEQETSYNTICRGEIIKDASGNTAIVVAEEKVIAGQSVLYVVNIKGNIAGAVTGLTSGATANITQKTAGNNHANINGSVHGLITIPEKTFRAGNIRITVNTSSTNDVTKIRSFASDTFVSQGTRRTRQDTVVSVRDGVVATVTGSETRSVTQSIQIDSGGGGDPLAQTFLLTEKNGAFVTSMDIFFYAKDENKPVSVEIVTVNNGYPSTNTVPFSKVFKQADDVVVSTNSLVATRFTFEAPVYLRPNTEYAVVIKSDSNVYRVWTSRLGQLDITTGKLVNSQPSLGSLFKSQNSSTWTAYQSEDLTFVMYKAKFDVSKTGAPVFANAPLSTDRLGLNPLQFTKGSRKVLVRHENHGLRSGDKVTLSGVVLNTTLNTAWPLVNGKSPVNGTYTVEEVRFDRYIITLPSSLVVSPWTGATGRASINATKNITVNEIELDVNYALPPTCQLFSGFRGWAFDWPLDNQWEAGLIMCPMNEQVAVNRLMTVLSPENEKSFSSGKRTLLTKLELSSEDENVSPVVDLSGMATIVVSNLINNPVESTLNVAGITERKIATGITVTFEADGFYTTNTSLFDEFDKIEIGKYIVLDRSGSTNDKTVLVTGKENYFSDTTGERNKVKVIVKTSTALATGSDTVTITIKDGFVDEVSPYDSSSYMKYIMSPMYLKNPATGFKIRMAYSMVSGAGISVWYKTATKTNQDDLESKAWTQLTLSGTEKFVNTPNRDTFLDFEVDRDDLPAFDAVMVKVVGTGNAGYQYPVFKDFRFIALA